ncbi:MAG: hypothetical protein ABI352_09390 [Candidatus Dormibacter sp.]
MARSEELSQHAGVRLLAHAIGTFAVEEKAANRCDKGIAIVRIVEQDPADAILDLVLDAAREMRRSPGLQRGRLSCRQAGVAER